MWSSAKRGHQYRKYVYSETKRVYGMHGKLCQKKSVLIQPLCSELGTVSHLLQCLWAARVA